MSARAPSEAWLDKRQIARKLGISTRTVTRLKLPCTRVGGQNRYFMSEVEHFLRGVPDDADNVVALRPRQRGGRAA